MSNIFQDIFGGGLSSLFHKDADISVLGIDVGSSSIKVVQIKKKGGKAILETYGALALGPYAEGGDIGASTNLPNDKLNQALLDVLKESNTTTKAGALAIPSSASLIFLVTLPGTIAEADLAAIIPTEARKYIPVPIAEVSLDWWMIPREAESVGEGEQQDIKLPESKTEVLVVAIHNETLTRYRELLTTSGIQSNFFEMEIFSSIRATFGHELSPVLLMDFGASKTKLSIVEYGIVRTFHVVNRGAQDITRNISQALSISFKDAEALKRDVGLDTNQNPAVSAIVKTSIDYIVAETNSVVLAYEKKYNKAISKVVLTGGGALLRGLHELMISTFSAEVVYGDPFGKTEAPAFLAPILATSGPEFAVAVGIALRQLS